MSEIEAPAPGLEAPNAFFTIGHSTRPAASFVELLRTASVQHVVDVLRGASIQQVVDVRTVPRSRTNPQFNRESLPGTLAEFQIGYEHIAELGGLRPRQFPGGSPNAFWKNDSFRNYADYATTEPFQAGLEKLRDLGRARRCAVMCAEMVWWRCHRRVIADYLIASGETVYHLMGQDRVEPAKLTAVAQRRGDGSLVYPPG